MFHQPSACLYQPLLQTRQRPVLNPLRECQPPPQIPLVVGENAEPQPDFITPEPVASYLMTSAVPGSCPRVSFTENGDPTCALNIHRSGQSSLSALCGGSPIQGHP